MSRNTPKKATRTPKQLAADAADEQLGSVRQILSNLFRRMLHNLSLADSWEQLMQDYVRDPINGAGDSRPAQSQARWNLQKAILVDYMSWRSFCKAMRFLKLAKFQVVIISWQEPAKRGGDLIMKKTSSPIIDLRAMSVENLDEIDEADDDETRS